jgi:hypothetical protein
MMPATNAMHAYVQDFVKNDGLILPMLTVFAHCPRRLQATRNARNLHSVSSTVCPVFIPPLPHHARHAHLRDLVSVDFFLCWQARIITALTIPVAVLCREMTCTAVEIFRISKLTRAHSEDTFNTFSRNVGKFPLDYAILHLRGEYSSRSFPWEFQIIFTCIHSRNIHSKIKFNSLTVGHGTEKTRPCVAKAVTRLGKVGVRHICLQDIGSFPSISFHQFSILICLSPKLNILKTW